MARLSAVMAREVSAVADYNGYVVCVEEGNIWRDDGDELDAMPENGYVLTVSVGGMPPHAYHEFKTLAEVEHYIGSGEVLGMTASYRGWRANDGD